MPVGRHVGTYKISKEQLTETIMSLPHKDRTRSGLTRLKLISPVLVHFGNITKMRDELGLPVPTPWSFRERPVVLPKQEYKLHKAKAKLDDPCEPWEWQDNEYSRERLRSLAAALIAQAVRDIRRRKDSREAGHKESAIDWINGTPPAKGYIFSFKSCCRLIGLDPERLKRKINVLSRKGL